MIERLLSFLDASPVSFLAVRNIANELEKNGFRRVNAQEPLGKVEAGDRFFVTKNDSSVYAFHIGKKPLADAGFHMICAHCDSPTFRVKPNAEMDCEGGIVKLNTEVYGGPIMSTWFDRPLTLAGRVIVKGDDVMRPKTLLLHVKRPLLQISNLAIHFNRQVNDGVKLSRQKDVLPILGIINDEMEKGNLLMNVITDELNVKKEDILDFDLYLADATPACTFGAHGEFISSGRLDDLSMCWAGVEAMLADQAGSRQPVPLLHAEARCPRPRRHRGSILPGSGEGLHDLRRQRPRLASQLWREIRPDQPSHAGWRTGHQVQRGPEIRERRGLGSHLRRHLREGRRALPAIRQS